MMGFFAVVACMAGILWVVYTILFWLIGTHYHNKGWETTKTTLFSVIGGQINWIMGIPRFIKTLRIW